MRSGDPNYRLLGFIAWLKDEMQAKEYDEKMLAKASDLENLDIKKVLRGELSATVLRDIAVALDLSVLLVFQKAIAPGCEDDKLVLCKAVRNLNRDGLDILEEMLRNAW